MRVAGFPFTTLSLTSSEHEPSLFMNGPKHLTYTLFDGMASIQSQVGQPGISNHFVLRYIYVVLRPQEIEFID
jgi:hypothetical protein